MVELEGGNMMGLHCLSALLIPAVDVGLNSDNERHGEDNGMACARPAIPAPPAATRTSVATLLLDPLHTSSEL